MGSADQMESWEEPAAAAAEGDKLADVHDLALAERHSEALGRHLRASDRADELEREIAGLRQALATRNLIGQAQGVLIERYGIDADEAFATLVRLSQQSHLKLRDVARRLVDTTVAEKRGTA